MRSKLITFVIEDKLKENVYNIGTGKDLTIKEIVETIQKIVDHAGEIHWEVQNLLLHIEKFYMFLK